MFRLLLLFTLLSLSASAYFISIDKRHKEKISADGVSFNTPSDKILFTPISASRFLKAKKRHKHQIHNIKEGVTIYPQGIVIAPKGAKKRIFKNNDTIGDKAMFYHYVGYSPLLKSYIVKGTHYDEATFYIIHRFIHHEFETVGIPYIAPDKKHIFAYNVLGQDPFTDMELWDIDLKKHTQKLKWQIRDEDAIINDAAYEPDGSLLLKLSDAEEYFDNLYGKKAWHYRYVLLDRNRLKKVAKRLQNHQ